MVGPGDQCDALDRMAQALKNNIETKLKFNANPSVRATSGNVRGPYIFTRNPYWTVAHNLIPESSGNANRYPVWIKEGIPYRRSNKRNILTKIESRLNLEPSGCNGSWVRWRSIKGRNESLLKHVECIEPPSLVEHFEVLKAQVESIFPELLEPAMQASINSKSRNTQAASPKGSLTEQLLIFRTTLLEMLEGRQQVIRHNVPTTKRE